MIVARSALLCGALYAGRANADANTVLAQSLFDEGKQLMAGGRFSEACPKLEASYKLDPAAGTLLNMAVCHETIGRTATAWAEFKDARSEARKQNRADREKLASEHIKSLEPNLSRLAVVVPASAQAAGLEIKVDGTVLDRAVWGTALLFDPGTHVVVANAPGKKTWTTNAELGARADSQQVLIPPLVDTAPAPDSASPAANPPSTVPLPAPILPSPLPDDRAVHQDAISTRRTLAYVAGGVGAAGLAVGSIFGIVTFAKKGERDEACPSRVCASQQGLDLDSQARTAATVSTVGFGVGLVGLGVGTWLWLTSSAKEESKPTAKEGSKQVIWVTPELGTAATGIRIGGAF